jgi:hypothetical protein
MVRPPLPAGGNVHLPLIKVVRNSEDGLREEWPGHQPPRWHATNVISDELRWRLRQSGGRFGGLSRE